MSRIDRFDGDVGMRSWVSGRDGVRVRDGLVGRGVAGACRGLEFRGDGGVRGILLLEGAQRWRTYGGFGASGVGGWG